MIQAIQFPHLKAWLKSGEWNTLMRCLINAWLDTVRSQHAGKGRLPITWHYNMKWSKIFFPSEGPQKATNHRLLTGRNQSCMNCHPAFKRNNFVHFNVNSIRTTCRLIFKKHRYNTHFSDEFYTFKTWIPGSDWTPPREMKTSMKYQEISQRFRRFWY